MSATPELERVIYLTVWGGVAYVCEDTVPPGVRVEIIDFDNLEDSAEEYHRLSPATQAYVKGTLEWCPPS